MSIETTGVEMRRGMGDLLKFAGRQSLLAQPATA